MCKIPVGLWIANAAAFFSGHHGAVTRQAQLHQVSRQTVYNHAHQVQEAIQVEHSEAPSRERLLQENQELRRENGRLWDWLSQTIEFPRAKQREFSILAHRLGLDLGRHSGPGTLYGQSLGTGCRRGSRQGPEAPR
jgi:hypothetical protein